MSIILTRKYDLPYFSICGAAHSKEKKRVRERKCEHLNYMDVTH